VQDVCAATPYLALTPNPFWDSAGQGSSKKTMPWKRGVHVPFLMATLKRGGDGDDVPLEL